MKAKPKRVTVYVDPDLHKALRLKAAETERPYSALVNEALRQSLAEDGEDLAADRGTGQRAEHAVRGIREGSQRRGKL